MSKPAWSNTSGFDHAGFFWFVLVRTTGRLKRVRGVTLLVEFSWVHFSGGIQDVYRVAWGRMRKGSRFELARQTHERRLRVFRPGCWAGLILGCYAALASGRWSYMDRMLAVSILGAGLSPLLQMTILPPLTFLCTQWWASRSASKEVF